VSHNKNRISTINTSRKQTVTNQVMTFQQVQVHFYSVSVHWGTHNSTCPWHRKPLYKNITLQYVI